MLQQTADVTCIEYATYLITAKSDYVTHRGNIEVTMHTKIASPIVLSLEKTQETCMS